MKKDKNDNFLSQKGSQLREGSVNELNFTFLRFKKHLSFVLPCIISITFRRKKQTRVHLDYLRVEALGMFPSMAHKMITKTFYDLAMVP